MIINNNTSAFNVWGSYQKNVTGIKKSMNRLSTGLILTADDPAGVGISERLRALTDSTDMAMRNLENGISMTQTSEGWLNNISDQLSRMKELAVQAQGVMSAGDRDNIEAEFKQMQDEIVRTTSGSTAAARFNGVYLFRGGDGVADVVGDQVDPDAMELQDGPELDQVMDLDLANLDVSNTDVIGTIDQYAYDANNALIGSTHQDVTWRDVIDSENGVQVTDLDAIGVIDQAIDYVAEVRASMGAQQNRMQMTYDGLMAYNGNLREAESKVRNVDMAMESTKYAKYMIMSQASNAMLGQANNLPANSILALLN